MTAGEKDGREITDGTERIAEGENPAYLKRSIAVIRTPLS
jgi:hypothetical protein